MIQCCPASINKCLARYYELHFLSSSPSNDSNIFGVHAEYCFLILSHMMELLPLHDDCLSTENDALINMNRLISMKILLILVITIAYQCGGGWEGHHWVAQERGE